jgi:hypothetical protein
MGFQVAVGGGGGILSSSGRVTNTDWFPDNVPYIFLSSFDPFEGLFERPTDPLGHRDAGRLRDGMDAGNEIVSDARAVHATSFL